MLGLVVVGSVIIGSVVVRSGSVVIFDILEPPAFQKYITCWVFQALCICVFVYLRTYYLCISVFLSDPCAHGVRSLGRLVSMSVSIYETFLKPCVDYCQCCQCVDTLVDDPSEDLN